MQPAVCIGIDVSKAHLDAAGVRGTVTRYRNGKAGIARLVAQLRDEPGALAVLEAGAYTVRLEDALSDAAIPYAKVNPRQVRDFARAEGVLAKTDALDAHALARFGERMRPPVRERPDAPTRALAARVARLNDLGGMIDMEKHRLEHAPAGIRAQILAHLRELKRARERQLADIELAINAHAEMARKAELLESVPGVGPILTATLLAGMPELGRIGRKQIAALAGVAPFNRDSGKFSGRKRVWGGRANVRRVLYMGALVGTRFNPIIRAYYLKLTQEGKPVKVAFTACMRKLLVILNAMMQRGEPWSPRIPAAAP